LQEGGCLAARRKAVCRSGWRYHLNKGGKLKTSFPPQPHRKAKAPRTRGLCLSGLPLFPHNDFFGPTASLSRPKHFLHCHARLSVMDEGRLFNRCATSENVSCKLHNSQFVMYNLPFLGFPKCCFRR
jgi:hypothetical protein